MQFKRLSEIDVRGKRVFIRADLNVPQDGSGNITEDTRIRASVPCIQMALDAGAAVMVTSHLGRPTEGAFKPADSLAPVAKRLGELLGREVPLVSNWVDGVSVAPGQLVMLENCRLNVGEKKNDEALARKLAALCDIFVNDAFGTAHRAEGTTYGIAQYAPIACAGPLLAAELDAINPVGHQRHLAPEQLAQALRHRRQRVLGFERAFGGASQVRGDHHRGTGVERHADAPQRGADAGVLGDASVVVLRHVHVGADEHAAPADTAL
jgi:hypothetical protein